MDVHRRKLVLAGAGSLGAALFPAQAALLATPQQTEGPFYPWRLPLETDNDLARVVGRKKLARGDLTHLVGRVLDTSGAPLSGAVVEIWQCDAQGHYHHVDDRDPTERDPNFQGYGRSLTSADGGYRFRTIRPVSYPGRTPHIHIKVRSGEREHATQIYIRDDARNARDFLFNALSIEERERVQARFEPVNDAQANFLARFDLVLP